jgi:hypothetical protein
MNYRLSTEQGLMPVTPTGTSISQLTTLQCIGRNFSFLMRPASYMGLGWNFRSAYLIRSFSPVLIVIQVLRVRQAGGFIEVLVFLYEFYMYIQMTWHFFLAPSFWQ